MIHTYTHTYIRRWYCYTAVANNDLLLFTKSIRMSTAVSVTSSSRTYPPGSVDCHVAAIRQQIAQLARRVQVALRRVPCRCRQTWSQSYDIGTVYEVCNTGNSYSYHVYLLQYRGIIFFSSLYTEYLFCSQDNSMRSPLSRQGSSAD